MRILLRLCVALSLLLLIPPVAPASPLALAMKKVTTMEASWYGIPFHGRTMANGKTYDMYDPLTVAHKSLPFGTKLEVTNPKNGRTCRAIVRDRGPFIQGRSLDFSLAAAECLGFKEQGTALLRVRIVG